MKKELTKEYFDKALERLVTKEGIAALASKGDIGVIKEDLKEIKADTAETKALVNSLHISVDTYLKRTETWHDELEVLQARFKQVVHLLDQKGIIKEEDTHLK